MIELRLPDGKTMEFSKGVTGLEVANHLAPSLGKLAICIKFEGKLQDIYIPIEESGNFEIITEKSPYYIEVLRHDAAHVLAEAIKNCFPKAQIVIGPAIENGFYYDVAVEEPFTPETLIKLEEEMKSIVSKKKEIRREILQREEAIQYFKSIGEFYKAEIIGDIPENEEISIYRQENFIDLCRGPHGPHTGFVKHFKLLKVSGSHFKGDPRRGALQRIYGTAFPTKEALQAYLHMLTEAEKRDHRKLGTELSLFHISESATGSIFWHPKGWSLFLTLQEYIRKKQEEDEYLEIRTPLILNKELWERSGHWEKFQENMFICESEKRTFAIKPMSCPGHIEVFKQGVKSYRDLPLRFAEFGSCHRNEPSGSLHGIMRVRGFTQDDGHIFCTESQIKQETIRYCKFLMSVYGDFGFHDIKIKFSTRPSKRAGNDQTWDKAERALEDAMKDMEYQFEINPGEGAFYGPKLEFVLVDALGRDWQCGTLQVDFILPERLGATYISETGNKTFPVMLHRATFGSFERFIGMLVENFAGKFPVWLAPVQAIVCGVVNSVDEYAAEVAHTLKRANFRVEADINSEKITYKIRKYSIQKIPYIIIIGEQEKSEKTISIRCLGFENTLKMTLEDFTVKLSVEIESKKLASL